MTARAWQLGLDSAGREHPGPEDPGYPPAPLSGAQRAILQLVRERGEVRSSEVGRLMHASRPWSITRPDTGAARGGYTLTARWAAASTRPPTA